MALPPKDKPPQNQRLSRQDDRSPRYSRVGPNSTRKSSSNPLVKAILILGVVFAMVVTLLMGYAFLVAKPNLPKISALTDYNPKTPKPQNPKTPQILNNYYYKINFINGTKLV